MEKEDIKKILAFTLKVKVKEILNLPEKIFLPLFFFGPFWRRLKCE